MRLLPRVAVLLLLPLLLATDSASAADASADSASAADTPCADNFAADASTADGSTDRKRCSGEDMYWEDVVPDREGSWWLGDGDGLPTFCRRLETVDLGTDGAADGAAPLGRWPWMVLFGRQAPSGPLTTGTPPPHGTENILRDVFCGGVLVGWGFVVTTTRCLSANLHVNKAGALAVLLGDHAEPLPDGSYAGAVRRVSHVLRHPHADIALALLDVMFEGFPKSVRPVCLPALGALEPPGLLVEVAGWGAHESDGDAVSGTAEATAPPRGLREASLMVWDADECEAAHRDAPQFEQRFPGGFNGTAVCAVGGSAVLHAAWCGPHGGWPLITVRPDGLVYELVGVATSGVGCGDPALPSVFTRVSAYVDWITDSLTP